MNTKKYENEKKVQGQELHHHHHHYHSNRRHIVVKNEKWMWLCKELTLTAPFSPIRYETSPGSTHTDNSAGKFSKISPIGTPLSRAAISNTTSIGSPVLRHRNAEPYRKRSTQKMERNISKL